MGNLNLQSLKNHIESLLLDSPAGALATDIAKALDEVGLAASVAVELMMLLEQKFGVSAVADLKPYLTDEGARAARLQADVLEAEKLKP